MPESKEFPGRYLSYGENRWLAKRHVEERHPLTEHIEVTIADSDPWFVALFWTDGKLVLTEHCISDAEAWLWRTQHDSAFLKHIESL